MSWAALGRESFLRELQITLQRVAPNHGVTCWVTTYGRIRVEVYTSPGAVTVFKREEDFETFPVAEIAAQIMLVAG